jgi:hypothetical protein
MKLYFSNLEFLWDQGSFGPALQRRRRLLTLAAYALLCLGLFARQITGFPTVSIRFENISLSVLGASFLIGLALFPPIMRHLNQRRRKPTWEHALSAFSIGFFVDLSNSRLFMPLYQKLFG